MRKELCETLKVHFQAEIMKHRMNIEVMLNNPMAIHDHTDWMAAAENELCKIAEYEDKLSALTKHFMDK